MGGVFLMDPIVERLIEIQKMDPEYREQELRTVYTKLHVTYYNDGRPVKRTLKEVERTIQYQLAFWNINSNLLVYPEDAWFVVINNTQKQYLKASEVRELLKQLQEKTTPKEKIQMTGTEIINQSMEKKAEATIKQLIGTAKIIKDRMEKVINSLEKDGLKANINTLGEIQNLGSELDRLCGEVRVYQETLELMAILREEDK